MLQRLWVGACVVAASTVEHVLVSSFDPEVPAPYPESPQPTGSVPLLLISTAGMVPGDIVTLETLSGGLARAAAPQIYRLNRPPVGPGANDSMAVFLSEMVSGWGVKTDMSKMWTLNELLNATSSHIRGYVRFASNSTDSTSAALMYCAGSTAGGVHMVADKLVVAASEPLTIALLDELGLPRLHDLSDATPLDTYLKMRAGLSHRLVCMWNGATTPQILHNLASYAVFGRAAICEWNTSTCKHALADAQAAGPGFAVVGGWSEFEDKFITSVNAFGGYTHAADWAINLEVLTNLPPSMAEQQRRQGQLKPPLAPAKASVAPQNPTHTVTFVFTDGDNVQWMLNDMTLPSGNWLGSSAAGTVPMGFTIPPALVTLAPVVLGRVHKIAASKGGNISLIAGTSGIGCAQIDQFPTAAALSTFVNLTADYMGR